MTQALDPANPFLEAVAAALSQGKQQIGIVCDPRKEGPPLLRRLSAALGPVPLFDHDSRPARDPGIWGLVPGCKVTLIGWGQQLAGRCFDQIIVLNRPAVDELYSELSVRRWVSEVLMSRLLPGGGLEQVDA